DQPREARCGGTGDGPLTTTMCTLGNLVGRVVTAPPRGAPSTCVRGTQTGRPRRGHTARATQTGRDPGDDRRHCQPGPHGRRTRLGATGRWRAGGEYGLGTLTTHGAAGRRG